nr:MAG TPA: hypothetical protein [Caudoviricetes sp.]
MFNLLNAPDLAMYFPSLTVIIYCFVDCVRLLPSLPYD